MSAPLPDALRVRFQKLIEEGLSGRAAALRLKLSPATGAHWSLAIRQTGAARAAPQGRPKGKGKLADQQPFLLEVVEHDGDITMPELAAALLDATGVQTHPGSIGRFLRKLVFTYKKKTLVATERRRARAGAPRHQMEGQLATIAEHGAHDPIEVSGKLSWGHEYYECSRGILTDSRENGNRPTVDKDGKSIMKKAVWCGCSFWIHCERWTDQYPEREVVRNSGYLVEWSRSQIPASEFRWDKDY